MQCTHAPAFFIRTLESPLRQTSLLPSQSLLSCTHTHTCTHTPRMHTQAHMRAQCWKDMFHVHAHAGTRSLSRPCSAPLHKQHGAGLPPTGHGAPLPLPSQLFHYPQSSAIMSGYQGPPTPKCVKTPPVLLVPGPPLSASVLDPETTKPMCSAVAAVHHFKPSNLGGALAQQSCAWCSACTLCAAQCCAACEQGGRRRRTPA